MSAKSKGFVMGVAVGLVLSYAWNNSQMKKGA
jgi:hypothetical protein